jgi:hypothetical protein
MGSGGIAPPFLTSALDGGEWSISSTGHFTLWEITFPRYPLTRRLSWAPVPVWSLCRVKPLAPDGNRTPTAQPVARRRMNSRYRDVYY